MSQFIKRGELGRLDEFFESQDASADQTPLQRAGQLIDWNLFEPELPRAVLRSAKGPGGKPRFAPLLMFQILVLQKLHGLADDATSFQIVADLETKKIIGHVCEKGVRGRLLTEEQRQANREKSKVRARVEPIFGALTGSLKAH